MCLGLEREFLGERESASTRSGKGPMCQGWFSGQQTCALLVWQGVLGCHAQMAVMFLLPQVRSERLFLEPLHPHREAACLSVPAVLGEGSEPSRLSCGVFHQSREQGSRGMRDWCSIWLGRAFASPSPSVPGIPKGRRRAARRVGTGEASFLKQTGWSCSLIKAGKTPAKSIRRRDRAWGSASGIPWTVLWGGDKFHCLAFDGGLTCMLSCSSSFLSLAVTCPPPSTSFLLF